VTWWLWLLAGACLGSLLVGVVVALVGRESQERRGGMVDLTTYGGVPVVLDETMPRGQVDVRNAAGETVVRIEGIE